MSYSLEFDFRAWDNLVLWTKNAYHFGILVIGLAESNDIGRYMIQGKSEKDEYWVWIRECRCWTEGPSPNLITFKNWIHLILLKN